MLGFLARKRGSLLALTLSVDMITQMVEMPAWLRPIAAWRWP